LNNPKIMVMEFKSGGVGSSQISGAKALISIWYLAVI
jgi:hypothetical protein